MAAVQPAAVWGPAQLLPARAFRTPQRPVSPRCSGPSGLTLPASNLSFSWATLDAAGGEAAPPAAAYECRLEGGKQPGPAYAPCSSPHALAAGLAPGPYRFHARLANSTTGASSEAVAAFELAPADYCNPQLWDCAPPTKSAARNPECGALGQPCCQAQGEGASEWARRGAHACRGAGWGEAGW